MKIEPGPQNLEALLSVKTVSIPSFQRNYVWKQENVKQLLDDLLEAASKNENHFFGPIILRSHSSGGVVSEYEVIDGQQRLTTSIMVLSVLRGIARDARYFKPANSALVTSITNFFTAPGVAAAPRFEASPLIRTFFTEAVTADPPKARITSSRGAMTPQQYADTKWIRKGYLFIDSYLRSKLDELSAGEQANMVHNLAIAVTRNFQVHSMVVEDETDAYRLFESMNYLGMKLEPGDLLKSLILRRIQETAPNQLTTAVNKWDDMWSQLSGFPVSKFLRHYLLSVEKDPVPAPKIYPILKSRVLGTPDGANKVLTELQKAASYYGGLLGHVSLGDPKLDGVASRLDLFSETHRLLLLAILNHTNDTPMRQKAFRAVEYLVFRKVAARENAQQTENKYQEFAKAFAKVTNAAELDQWCAKVTSGLLSDQQLRDLQVNNCTFAGIQYDPRENLARYANAVYESDRGTGWVHVPTLEHLAPQNPNGSSDWKNPGVVGSADNPYEVQIHWWGNLTWLEQPLNSGIGNAQWPTKLAGTKPDHADGLKGSGFAVTKQVCLVPVWNEDRIHERGNWLLEAMLKLRSLEWVNTGSNSAASVQPFRS